MSKKKTKQEYPSIIMSLDKLALSCICEKCDSYINGWFFHTDDIPTSKVYFYETEQSGGSGKIVGECSLLVNNGRISKNAMGLLRHEYTLLGGIKYRKPKSIEQFGKPLENGLLEALNQAPSSWCYAKPMEDAK